MQHMMNAITKKGTQDDVWYVDSGASNHMTSHDEWFGEMQDLQIRVDQPMQIAQGSARKRLQNRVVHHV